ncbi:MAG: TonB family protein [Blastocatellales bacterium]
MLAVISLTLLFLTATFDTPVPATNTLSAVFEDAEIKKARQAYDARDFHQAVAVLKTYLEKKPKSFDGYFLLGLSCQALNQYEEAVAALEIAVRLKSKSMPAQFELGKAYIGVKNYEAAVRQYRFLEKKDKCMATEFELYLPAEVAKQNQLPSLPEHIQSELENIYPLYSLESGLKPEILYRERARYSEEARNEKVNGKVILSVIYSKQGKLIVLCVVSGLSHGLNESSIEAAKKIRFRPAMKDGQPVSIKGTIEFTFSTY